VAKRSRTKGAAFEREIASWFNLRFSGLGAARRLGQARDSGHDLDVGPWVIECKRRKTLGTVEAWLRQAADAARESERPYAVVARSDGGQPFVILPLTSFMGLLGGSPTLRLPDDRA